MRIHVIRNATVVVNTDTQHILVDPILDFIRMAPGQVIATHLEALNHCPLTRARFWEAVTQAGLAHKTRLPADGAILEL